MKRLAEVKDSLDIDVKQNFIDPLQGLCDKDLREIQVHGPAVLPHGSKLHVSSLDDFSCGATLALKTCPTCHYFQILIFHLFHSDDWGPTNIGFLEPMLMTILGSKKRPIFDILADTLIYINTALMWLSTTCDKDF